MWQCSMEPFVLLEPDEPVPADLPVGTRVLVKVSGSTSRELDDS